MAEVMRTPREHMREVEVVTAGSYKRLKDTYNELLREVIYLRNEIALYSSDDPYTQRQMIEELNVILMERKEEP